MIAVELSTCCTNEGDLPCILLCMESRGTAQTQGEESYRVDFHFHLKECFKFYNKFPSLEGIQREAGVFE